jgi:hypothetical protein
MIECLELIISGLAFLGLGYTAWLQKTELSLQRKELKLTREELAKTAEAQIASEKALVEQAKLLKSTAELNGLSSLLRHNDAQLENLQRSGLGGDLKITLIRENKKIKESINNHLVDLSF